MAPTNVQTVYEFRMSRDRKVFAHFEAGKGLVKVDFSRAGCDLSPAETSELQTVLQAIFNLNPQL